MPLGVKPIVFLARLLFFFALTYFLWEYVAPFYTRLLAAMAQVAMRATELFGPPPTRAATTVFAQGRGIFFVHRMFPHLHPPGIPADWVQANMVLLIPLMLATPAPTWRARFVRLGIAVGVAMALQVIGLVVAIKSTWAWQLGGFSFEFYSNTQRTIYQFTDAFFESFDTQLFPVVIWAGVHFRQLIRWVQPKVPEPAVAASGNRAAARRQQRTRTKARR